MKETSNVLVIKVMESIIYIYLHINNVFKYLFFLSDNKESYLHYYYIKVLRFSLDPFPRSSSLPIMILQNNCINNGVSNGLKQKRKKACKQIYMVK